MDEEMREQQPKMPNPRRRKRSKMRIFKEVYLPVIILGLALILIISFIVGAIVRSVQKNHTERDASIAASQAADQLLREQMQEANDLILRADALAAGYDYKGAMDLLNSFSGDPAQFKTLSDRKTYYGNAIKNLVEWKDPNKIPNLSFQLLIADPERAFKNESYGSSFKNNFITTGEFSRILQQLYDNGYILVGLEDVFQQDPAGGFQAKSIFLPNGKKPLMLTQTNVNYNLYLVDSDKDMLPDKNGGGFASRLILGQDGKISCEMVDKNGETQVGAFDFVPILDEFVEKHPDFSYKGSKAVLALTGYNGLFGYRTHPDGIKKFGQEAYNQDVKTVQAIADTLRNSGYTLACYTYENIAYGSSGMPEITADLNAWNSEVVPILGQTDVFVFAQNSDISGNAEYIGEKYEALRTSGFHYFLGFCQDGVQRTQVSSRYVRQGRLLVSGSNLSGHSDWFSMLFDAASVLDSVRKG